MVRIRIKKIPRKKRVTWLDEIQAEASRPRASYTPPPTDEASIMKFIHKKAADQRRANVNRMAGVVFGQQALRSYTAAQKKTTPTRQSSSALAQDETRHGPFPTLPRKCVLIPNNRPSIPWWDGSLAANRKWPSGYKKGPRTLRRASSS